MSEVATVTILHAGATTFMVGLIWFVQVVHYPLLTRVGGASFVDYESAHMRRTTWVVGPVMLGEMLLAVWCVLLPLDRDAGVIAMFGLLLLGVVWLSTVFLQVPCHHRLRDGFDERVARRLVRSNWIRTGAWTTRAILAWALVTLALAG